MSGATRIVTRRFPRRRDRARRHDARHRARVRRQQRHERAPLEPDAPHRAVDDERGAGHVADVLEQVEHREEHEDLRQEDDHRAHAGDDSVGDEVGGEAGGQRGAHEALRRAHRDVDRVHRRLGPREDELEEQHHDRAEEQRAEHRVEHHAVDARGARVAARRRDEGARRDRVRPRRAVLGRGRRRHDRRRPRLGPADQPPQLADADAAVPDDADHRHAERSAERLEVDAPAARVQLVDHRDDETGRQPEPQHLRDEEQRARQRAGVGRHDQRVGRRDLGHLAAQQPRDDGLVRADRIEAVGAGQVDHHDRAPVDLGAALAPLDRHAGVVSDLRAEAGQCVEERRLARVRRAEEAEAERGGAHRGSTSTCSASLRRRHSCAPRTS